MSPRTHRAILRWCSAASRRIRSPAHRDCRSNVVITADEGLRGGRKVPLKANGHRDRQGQQQSIIYRGRAHAARSNGSVADVHCPRPPKCTARSARTAANARTRCSPPPRPFGKPKGVLHTTGGYNVYVAMTHQLVFDI
jgi:acetyl-CoA synthetase